MIIIQIILIILAIGIVIVALGDRASHSGKAYRKIALVTLAFVMVFAVLFPETTNIAARLVGVGRGADLLLYMLFSAFIFYVLNRYVKDQDQRDLTYRLARRVALDEANRKYKIK